MFDIKPTSVTESGLGVYARHAYAPGATLFKYPGKRVTAAVFDELNEFFSQLVDNWKNPDAALLVLYQKYDIVIRRHEVLIGVPNWRAIYKSFIQCIISNDYNDYIYWHTYDWATGAIAGTSMCAKNPGILINEPPPYDSFYNIERCGVQKSVTNVRTETREDREIYFVVKNAIQAGDELLIHYGPFFERNYHTNLALCNVQNYAYDAAELDEDNAIRVKHYENAIINYKSHGEMLNISEKNKRSKTCTDSTSI